jgi:hypothetical protein
MAQKGITTPGADKLGYGTSSEVCQLLDAVSVTLREEPQSHWDEDPDLREATKAVADHLYHRLRIRQPSGVHSGIATCPRDATSVAPASGTGNSVTRLIAETDWVDDEIHWRLDAGVHQHWGTHD